MGDGSLTTRPTAWWRRASGAFAAIGAIVAAASGLTLLAFTLKPELAPDPRAAFSGELSVIAVERGVTLRSYVRDITPSGDGRAEQEASMVASLLGDEPSAIDRDALLATPGTAIYVRSLAEGFKRREVTLRWRVHAARSGMRIRHPALRLRTAATIALDTTHDRTVQELWVPPLPNRRPAFVRVALYTLEGNEMLAMADSPVFRSP